MNPPYNPENVARLTRRYPDLATVPEAERLPLMLKARRQPAVLGTFCGLLLVWLVVCGPTVIALTNHTHGKGDLFAKLFLPALLPIMVIFFISGWVLRRTIHRLVEQRQSTPPTMPPQP